MAQNMVGSPRVPRGQTVRDWPVWGEEAEAKADVKLLASLRTWVGSVLLGLCQFDKFRRIWEEETQLREGLHQMGL